MVPVYNEEAAIAAVLALLGRGAGAPGHRLPLRGLRRRLARRHAAHPGRPGRARSAPLGRPPREPGHGPDHPARLPRGADALGAPDRQRRRDGLEPLRGRSGASASATTSSSARGRTAPPLSSRRMVSAGSRAAVHLLIGNGVRDVNSPYRLMRRDALRPLLDQVPDDAFAPNTLLSGLAARARLRILEVPVPHEGRRTGRGSLNAGRLIGRQSPRSLARHRVDGRPRETEAVTLAGPHADPGRGADRPGRGLAPPRDGPSRLPGARSAPRPRAGSPSSFLDEHGFTWDVGGHVQFSHYAYYDAVLDRALGDAWLRARARGVGLDQGALRALSVPEEPAPADRRGRGGGAGRSRSARPRAAGRPARGLRAVDRAHVRRLDRRALPLAVQPQGLGLSARRGSASAGWASASRCPTSIACATRCARARTRCRGDPTGPFRFPLRRRHRRHLARRGAACCRTISCASAPRVASVDLERRDGAPRRRRDARATTRSCRSIPLDRLCARWRAASTRETLDAAASLVQSAVHVLGVGLARRCRPPRCGRSAGCTSPSDHSPVLPRHRLLELLARERARGGCWSLMAEVCETPHRPVEPRRSPPSGGCDDRRTASCPRARRS